MTGRHVAGRVVTLAGLVGSLWLGYSSTAAEAPEPSLTCDPGDTGIWAPLNSSNHDNLVQAPDRSQVSGGDILHLGLTWEWRDWKPGAQLQIRVCTDVDGPPELDGKPTPPHQGSQLDFATTHPQEPPANRGGEKDRPLVSRIIAVPVPNGPPGGELCIRVAVFGNPDDHRKSPPAFDIAETICDPIVDPPPVVASMKPPPPAPMTRLPVTGGLDTRLMGLALALVSLGFLFETWARRSRPRISHHPVEEVRAPTR